MLCRQIDTSSFYIFCSSSVQGNKKDEDPIRFITPFYGAIVKKGEDSGSRWNSDDPTSS